jgi:hypothetical protein
MSSFPQRNPCQERKDHKNIDFSHLLDQLYVIADLLFNFIIWWLLYHFLYQFTIIYKDFTQQQVLFFYITAFTLIMTPKLFICFNVFDKNR